MAHTPAPPTAGTVAAARARLEASGADGYIRELVDAAPPLPVEAQARLAAILNQPASTA